MKTLLSLFPLCAFAALAQAEPSIELFDERLNIRVSQADSTGDSEQQYWQMLEQKGWQAVKNATRQLTLSPALQEELTYQASLEQLTTLNQTQQYQQAQQLLLAHSEWQSCQRIQWLWQDMRTEVSSGYGPKAKQKYQNLLEQCSQFNQASTEKLLSWSAPSHHQDIVNRYEKSANVDPAFVRQLHENLKLNTLSQTKPKPKQLRQVEQIAKQRNSGQIAETLGWKYLDNQQPKLAQQWFEQSIRWSGPTEKRVTGLMHSYQVDQQSEAFDITKQRYREQFPAIAAMRWSEGENELGQHCNEEQPAGVCLQALAQLTELTPEQQALKAWKLHELARPYSAVTAFEAALSALDRDDEAYQQTQYGYILALEKAGFSDKAANQLHQLQDREKQYQLEQQFGMSAITQSFEQRQYSKALTKIRQYEQLYGDNLELAELKAWSFFHTNRKQEALAVYGKLKQAYPMDKSYQKAYQTIECSLDQQNIGCQSIGRL